MRDAGMEAESAYDYGSSIPPPPHLPNVTVNAVLTSDYAVLLAEDYGRHPIVNDEAAFDLYPPSVDLS